MKTSFVGLVRGSAVDFRKFDRQPFIFKPCLTLLILFFFSRGALERRVFAATPENTARGVATAITGVNVQLNGAQLKPGVTLFQGDELTLGADSSAAVQMKGKNDLLIAGEGTTLIIEAEGIRLRAGRVRVRLAGADTFPVTGPFFRVSIAPSGGNAGSAEIVTSDKTAQVAALAGLADVLVDGSEISHRVDAGKIAVMDAAGEEVASAQDANSAPAQGKAPPVANSPQTPGQNSKPSGKRPVTIYIISAAVGGAAIGVGLYLSSREMVSPP